MSDFRTRTFYIEFASAFDRLIVTPSLRPSLGRCDRMERLILDVREWGATAQRKALQKTGFNRTWRADLHDCAQVRERSSLCEGRDRQKEE